MRTTTTATSCMKRKYSNRPSLSILRCVAILLLLVATTQPAAPVDASDTAGAVTQSPTTDADSAKRTTTDETAPTDTIGTTKDHHNNNHNNYSTNGDGVRMITMEELRRNDGNQTDRLWLSILGKVYDVTAGEQYYRKGAPYQVFVGRDANVPFITGNFSDEEAKRPLVSLSPVELYSLETWSDFYNTEEKYKFVGLLIGELYDEQGNPTEEHLKVKEMIAEGKREQEERARKRKELIAQRKRESEEKRKRELENAKGNNSPKQEL
jgi:single-stranded DNA-specific DHH superfamily exonuclease